ncbi:hypothetical protein CRYUN_Cryun28dG0022100 [Craigia yunnanensis]
MFVVIWLFKTGLYIWPRLIPFIFSGEFVVVNKHLPHDLTETGLWCHAFKTKILYHNGSVSKILEIPEELKAIYKTVWEIKQKTLVDMAVDRRCYIDQSQFEYSHGAT